MRLTMSREAPTRSAISCCVSFSGISSLPSLFHRHVEQQARDAPVDVEQRQVLHAVGGEARAVDDLRDHVEREIGVAADRLADRARAPTTEKVVGSSVITEAERGLAVERHLAHVFAGTLRVEDHLVALGVREEDLHACR